MSDFEELRDDVLSTFVTLEGLITQYLAETRRRLLAESRDRLAAGRYYVVVCGEFRRGKSSLLNALVERPKLFPVDVDITTCAVVTLQWNAKDSAVVYFTETEPGNPASAREPQSIAIADAAEFVTEQANPGNAKNVLRIEMGAAIPQLTSGLVLVDTPGVGSLNPGHTAATRTFLPNADAILFVASAVEPLGLPELNFLKLALSQCPIVVTALTMIDRVVAATPVVEEARTRIAEASGTDAAGLVIVPVSSFRKRDALEEQDPELLAASGFPELEAEIWGGLAITCGAAQIHAALDAMDSGLAEAAAPIANDLAALRGDRQKMADELHAEQEKYQQLKADSHSWKRELQNDVDRAARPIVRQLDSDLDTIRDEFRQALGTEEAISNGPALVQRMSDAMIDAANQANAGLEAEMKQIADRYSKLTDLSITVSGVTTASFDPSMSGASAEARKRPQGYARFREMWLGASAGAGAGALLGTVVPFVGTAVGALVGFVVGLFGGRKHQQRNAEEQQRRAYIADLRDNVLPKLEAARRRLTRDMADQVRDYGRDLLKMLEDEVTAKGESIAESIRRLSEAAQQDAKVRADRERDLVRQQQELADLRAELDTLRARTDGLSREQSGKPRSADPAGPGGGLGS
jgi:gas vesicle protein